MNKISVLLISAAISTGCVGPAAPTSTNAPTIDVLDYIVGDSALWPRTGDQASNQVVDWDRREVCWTKYGNPRRFECWRWDDSYVYHATDNAIDGDTGESYHFTDGRWLPRKLSGTWSLDVPENQIVWFDFPCVVNASKSRRFSYRQRAWLEPGVDTGGDLGVRDILVLEYTPYEAATDRTSPERFSFARGAGWYLWQRNEARVVFNRRGGPNVPLDRSVWCE